MAQENADSAQGSKLSNLQLRLISAIILAPLVLLLIILGGNYFLIMLFSAATLMAYEWKSLTLDAGNKWLYWGLAYIVLPLFCLWQIRQMGLAACLYIFLLVWFTDIFAYFGGRLIGGPKLLPSISPKKTWAGLITGSVMASIFSMIYCAYFFQSMSKMAIFFGFSCAVISQAGDFFESYVKRKFGVKDSSNLIPGHGGILDRVDGLLFASVYGYIIFNFVL